MPARLMATTDHNINLGMLRFDLLCDLFERFQQTGCSENRHRSFARGGTRGLRNSVRAPNCTGHEQEK